MATKLVQSPIPTSHVVSPIPKTITKSSRAFTAATHPWAISKGFGNGPRSNYAIKVAEQSTGLLQNEDPSVVEIKTELYQALQGINRGIFGVPSEKKSEIEALVKLLEFQNPTSNPTTDLEKLGGCWKLIFSTITILGSKRTKLGLRDFISLGDFFQSIDIAEGKAVNVIKFNVRGLNLLNGQLAIVASFKIASKSRVDIHYENSSITPDQRVDIHYENTSITPDQNITGFVMWVKEDTTVVSVEEDAAVV